MDIASFKVRNFLSLVLKTLCVTILAFVILHEASARTLIELSVLKFWLAVLPGTLLCALMLGKSLRSFESWVIGTAVGINFLPVLDFVGAFFTDNAGLLWELVIIAISALNLVCLLALARKRTMNSGPTRLPVFPILVFVLGYLGLFLFQRFYRDSGHGLYAFNIFFGGDMGWLGSDVLCLEKHTKLAEWGFGGMPIYYHDIVFRALAGLHRCTLVFPDTIRLPPPCLDDLAARKKANLAKRDGMDRGRSVLSW